MLKKAQIIEYYCNEIIKMVKENEQQKIVYGVVSKKYNWEMDNWNILTQIEKDIYNQGERIHSKARLNRYRIELQKAMIDYSKGV